MSSLLLCVGSARLRKPSRPGLEIDWLDVLSAALTVGKPHFVAALAHPPYAIFEAQRRMALLLAHLMDHQMPDGGVGLVRTPVYDASDPTEKGAIAYSVGMTLALCFARARLGIGYLTHVDVRFGSSRVRRPDLVDATDDRSFVEAKGSSGPVPQDQMTSALDQLRANPIGRLALWRAATASCVGFRRLDRGDPERLSLHVQHLVRPPTPKSVTDAKLRAMSRDLANPLLVATFGPVATYLAATATGLFDAVGFPALRPRGRALWVVHGREDASYAVAFEPYLQRFIGLETSVYLRTMDAVKELGVSLEPHDLESPDYGIRLHELGLEERGSLLLTAEPVPPWWWR